MKASVRLYGLAALGSALALVAIAVTLTSGAQAASGFRSCPNRVVKFKIEGAEGEKPRTFSTTVKAISVKGVSCAAAYKFLRLTYNNTSGSSPQNYNCKSATFKVPLGYVPTICTKPGKKIKYAAQGG